MREPKSYVAQGLALNAIYQKSWFWMLHCSILFT